MTSSPTVNCTLKQSEALFLEDFSPPTPVASNSEYELSSVEGQEGDLIAAVSLEGAEEQVERDLALLRIYEELEKKPREPTLLRQKRYKNIFDCLNE